MSDMPDALKHKRGEMSFQHCDEYGEKAQCSSFSYAVGWNDLHAIMSEEMASLTRSHDAMSVTADAATEDNARMAKRERELIKTLEKIQKVNSAGPSTDEKRVRTWAQAHQALAKLQEDGK